MAADFTLRVTRIDAEHSGPIVATFLQGPPPRSVPLQRGSAPEAPLAYSYACGGAGEGKRAQHRRLRAESTAVAYSAQNFGAEAGGGAYRYAVGVVSRKRGVLELYEADGGGAVFGLQADGARGLMALLGEEGAAAQASSALAGLDARAKRDALVDSFGSQKKKKMESARKANIVDVNAVAAAQEVSGGAAAAAAAAAAAGSEGGSGAAADISGREEVRKRLLPPFDAAAAVPSDAYPLDTLLTPEAAALLKPLARALLKAAAPGAARAEGGEGEGEGEGEEASEAAPSTELPAEAEALLPTSFQACSHAREALQRLLALRVSGALDKGEAAQRLQCLLYAAHLIALYQCGKVLKARTVPPLPAAAAAAAAAAASHSPAEEGLSLDARIDDSLALAGLSLSRFYEARWRRNNLPVPPQDLAAMAGVSTQVTYMRTPESEKRLLYHIGALALRGDGFSLQIRALAEDMRISAVLLSKAFRELGCACVKDKGGAAGGGVGGFVVTLKLPLTFPLPPRGRQ